MNEEQKTKYQFRPMKWRVYPESQGPSGDFLTTIEIVDEGAGEYLLIKQPYARRDLSDGAIAIDPEEWESLKVAIDSAFNEIKRAEKP